ncbi:MAG TPA: endonuclease domain-containing protein, partial [Candidatus Gracilibacteria bacterium]
MNYITFLPYNQALKERARAMRKTPTPAEKKMWKTLCRNRTLGFKFWRQKPLDQFIVDFYCAELKLAIEVDGDIHDQQEAYDEERMLILEGKYGIQFLRFTNEQVMNDIEKVKKILERKIKTAPLPDKGGAGGGFN